MSRRALGKEGGEQREEEALAKGARTPGREAGVTDDKSVNSLVSPRAGLVLDS